MLPNFPVHRLPRVLEYELPVQPHRCEHGDMPNLVRYNDPRNDRRPFETQQERADGIDETAEDQKPDPRSPLSPPNDDSCDARDPGYANTPFGQCVFFDGRGTQTFDGPIDINGIPTQFIRSPTYGETQSPSDYYPGREFLVSLGIRF